MTKDIPLLNNWKLSNGAKFVPMPWELEVLKHVRDHDLTAYSTPRGSGKTGLLAQIAAYYGLGPGMVPGADVIITAGSLEQASLGWRDVLDGLKLCEPNWKREGVKIADYNAARCITLPQGGRVRALAANYRTQHGLRPILLAIDEPAQIHPEAVGEKILSAAITSMGKIPGARLVVCGTRPASDSHWFSRLLKTDGLTWAADKNDDPFSEATWKKCNPSWDYFPALRKAIRREAKRAKGDPLAYASFKAFRLNMGGSGTPDMDHVMTTEMWKGCETKTPPPREGVPAWGVDLGGGDAMSAIAAYWSSGRLECVAWLPDTPSLAERGRKHGAGDAYQRMYDRGELKTTPGRSVPVGRIMGEALELWGVPRVIACDRWKKLELLDALDKISMGHLSLLWRGQGYRDGSADLRSFMKAVLDGRIHTEPSLLLASAIANGRIRLDDAGNSKLIKSSGSSGHLIDSLSASVEAVAAHELSPVREWSYAFAPADNGEVTIM